MGGGGSKDEGSVKPLEPTIKSDFLLFKKCMFFTQEQYNNKVFLPEHLCYIKGTTRDLDSYVMNQINSVASRMPFGKVPGPIYVMYARKKEYTGTIFGECIDQAVRYKHEKARVMVRVKAIAANYTNKINNLKSTGIQRMLDGMKLMMEMKNEVDNAHNSLNDIITGSCESKKDEYLYIIDRLFVDENAFKKSEFSNFEYKGNFEVYIFIPNLDKDFKYLSNLESYSNSNQWIRNISSEKYYYTVVSMIKIDFKKLFERFIKDTNLLQKIVKFFADRQKKGLPFIREANNICYEQGCVASHGEDFNMMLPGYSSDTGAQTKSAKEKAPYYPRKCLKQRNYEKHMFEADENFQNKLKDYLLGNKCLKHYIDAEKKIQEDNADDIEEDVEPELLEQFKKCAMEYRYEEIGKEIDKFSEKYNKHILTELAKRKNGYPGIQEVVFPLFRVDQYNDKVNSKMLEMPWGNKLIGIDYVLNTNQTPEFTEGKVLKSFNEVYSFTVLRHGPIIVLQNGRYKYSLSNKYFPHNNKTLILESTGELVLYGEQNGDRIHLWSIPVVDPETVIAPFSLIMDNSGLLKVYGNGFKVVNSKKLNETMYNSLKGLSIDDFLPFTQDDFFKYISDLFKNIFTDSSTTSTKKDDDKDDYYTRGLNITDDELELFNKAMDNSGRPLNSEQKEQIINKLVGDKFIRDYSTSFDFNMNDLEQTYNHYLHLSITLNNIDQKYF